MNRRACLHVLLLLLLPVAVWSQSASPSAAPRAAHPALPLPARVLPPYVLIISGRPADVIEQQLMLGIERTYQRRMQIHRLSPERVAIMLVNIDNPKSADVVKRLGLQKGGVCVALARTDTKEATQTLDMHGPFRPDTRRYMRNPEFATMLDGMNTVFGKAMQQLGRPWAWAGLNVAGVARLTTEEQAMYQVQQDGVVVFHVAKGSAAQKAGLRDGDEITKLANIPIKNMTDYEINIASLELMGNVVKFTVRRGGKSQIITLTMSAYP